MDSFLRWLTEFSLAAVFPQVSCSLSKEAMACWYSKFCCHIELPMMEFIMKRHMHAQCVCTINVTYISVWRVTKVYWLILIFKFFFFLGAWIMIHHALSVFKWVLFASLFLVAFPQNLNQRRRKHYDALKYKVLKVAAGSIIVTLVWFLKSNVSLHFVLVTT